MVDMDLEIIHGKPESVKLMDKKYEFRMIKMRKHFKLEYLAQQIDKFEIKTEEDADKLADMIVKYIMGILVIKKAEAEELGLPEYKRLRQVLSNMDMYQQGFTDKEIRELEKKAVLKAAKDIT